MKKILIVEDDFIIQIFLKKIISEVGCKIVGTTNNSDNVIDIIDNENPNIIFMDISIDGKKNGIELSDMINSKYNIAIVYITGNTDEATMKLAKKTNPLHIISKPVDEETLVEEIKSVCEKYDQKYTNFLRT